MGNLLFEEDKKDVKIKKIKNISFKSMVGITVLSTLCLLGTVGANFNSIYHVKDSETITEDMRTKYDEAKKQDSVMKENISKLNAIANKKKNVSTLIDKAVASKPESVSLISMNINYSSKKSVIECMSTNIMSSNEYLQSLKNEKEFENAQILSTQTKNDITAFQIIVPLEKGNNNTSRTNKTAATSKK